jgi:hypothetical protein
MGCQIRTSPEDGLIRAFFPHVILLPRSVHGSRCKETLGESIFLAEEQAANWFLPMVLTPFWPYKAAEGAW